MQPSSPPAGRRDDLRRYWRVVRRHMLVLLAVLVAAPAGAYALTTQVPPVHEARATLRVEATTVISTVFTNTINLTTSDANEVARLLRTTAVARLAAEELGRSKAAARSLLGAIDVELEESTGLPSPFLTIVARDESPQRAARIANAFADALADRRTREAVAGIDRAIETLETQARTIPGSDIPARDSVARQLQELRALRATQGATTQVIEPAFAPGDAISPNPTRNAVLGGVLGALLCVALVALLDRHDRRLIRTPEDLEQLSDAPLLTVVPMTGKRRRGADPFLLESFQTLRASLTSFSGDRDLSSLLVTSPGRGDGKSTVASNLAFALADQGRDVLLVDGDMRRASGGEPAEVEGDGVGGLSGVLLGTQSLAGALVELDGAPGRLRLLPAGEHPPNPAVLLASESMRSLLAELTERADAVVIDTPPLLVVSDAVPLLDQVSGVILVARMDRTPREGMLRARRLIASGRGELLGVVASGAVGLSPYGYGYGRYGYEATVSQPVGRSITPVESDGKAPDASADRSGSPASRG